HRISDARRTEHRARRMGFVFQSFNLIPVFTAVENVELPLLVVGTPARKARRVAHQMLERVGLGGRPMHRPAELAGGEQPRLPTFRRLALRNALRRKNEALLVIAGSLFGTAIVTSAFVVGDTLNASIRNEARTRLGPVDEVALVHHTAALDEALHKITARPL